MEHDNNLAARDRVNTAPWPQVTLVQGDGAAFDAGDVDVIVGFAGMTHPAPHWLDRLSVGGRMMIGLTSAG